MSRSALTLAIAGAVPVLLIAAFSSIQMVSRLADPCMQWGVGRVDRTLSQGFREGQFSAALRPPGHAIGNDPCMRRSSGSTETKSETIRRLVTIPLGLFIASILGVAGVVSSKPLMTAAGSVILLGESIIIFSLAPVTLFAAVVLLLAARKSWAQRAYRTA
jgi:hypothetical protein